MHSGKAVLNDDPMAMAAFVRSLAFDAHAVLTRSGAEFGGQDESVGDMLRRIEDFQGQLGEGRPEQSRLDGVRLWLVGLKRQALMVQALGEHRRRVDRLEGGAEDSAE